MICLSCQQKIMDNVESCPFCHTKYSAEKLRFIKYLGTEDSLVGYQKSYKLLLLKNIFECLLAEEELSVDKIMCNIKEFYLNRVRNGLVSDYDVDERIKNISDRTTIYDLWAVYKANPYNVINNQGFLFLEKNYKGELIFVMLDEIGNLPKKEYENLLGLINKKLKLYYSKDGKEKDVESTKVVTVLESKCRNNTATNQEVNDTVESNESILKNTPIEQTNLSIRCKHCLMRSGYMTIDEILNLEEENLYSIKNMGQKSVEEIMNLINDFKGLKFADELVKIDEMDLKCPLKDTSLSARAKNVLRREGYKIVRDIIKISEEQLYTFQSIGRLTVQEILDFTNKVCNANDLNKQENCEENSFLSQSIKSTKLSTRAKNSLSCGGFKSVKDILALTEPEICELPSVGANTVEEILLFVIGIKQSLADNITDAEYEVFQTLKYPYYEISEECENVPVTVLACFGMQPSLIKKLQLQSISKLGQLKKMDYDQIRISMGSDWIKLLHFTLKEFFNGAIVATKLFLDNISKEEDLSFIVARSRGATLQELGNKRGFTREGARQHIEKPLQYIKPMAVSLAKALISKSQVKFLTLQDIYDVYDNDDYDAIISYALNESEEIETIDSLGLYFIKNTVSYNDALSQAISEHVGDGIFWKREIPQLIEILQEKNLSFIDVNDAWLYMLSQGYRVYGEYVVPHTVPSGNLLAIVVDEEFPNGISFSNEEDVTLLREGANKRFGDLNLPKEDRAISARVIDLLVLSDRGRWISPNRVFIDISTLESIKEFIDKSEQDIIYYQALFNQFEGLLAMTSDIFNYHYLHGVLKYYYGADYIFNRDYLQKNTGTKTGSLEGRIYEFIRDKGVAVSRGEIKDYLKITSDAMITNVILNSKKIFQWEFNYYNCLANIDIRDVEEEFLDEIITAAFEENKNYCSAKIVFEYCAQIMPELLQRNSIKSATNLFYLVATLMKDKYRCRIPHILPRNSPLSTTEDVARMFMQDPIILKWNEFAVMAERFGWGQSTAGIIFEALTKDNYYRISRTNYLRKSELLISSKQVEDVLKALKLQIDDKEYIGVWEINFSKFPEIGYEWNPYLLESIVSCFIKEYRSITTNYGSNKAERGLYVPYGSEILNFDELVVKVMKDKNKNVLTENEMYTLLVLSGIIKNSVPNELRESKFFVFKDGAYTIKESI